MANFEKEPLSRYWEVGLKALLVLWGFCVFVLGLVVGLRTWTLGTASIISDGGVALGLFLIALAAFLGTIYWYLTSTDPGLRLLARLPPYRGRFAKTK